MTNTLDTVVGSVSTRLDNSTKGPDISTLLKDGGFNIDPEFFQNLEQEIKKDPALLDAMKRDIAIVQNNPTEKSYFESLYINGYGQKAKMKDGREMSFAEIYAAEKAGEKDIGDSILDGDISDNYIKYKKRQVNSLSNQVKDERIVKEGALNQGLIEVGGKMDSLIEQAKSILDDSSKELLEQKTKEVQAQGEKSDIFQSLVRQGIPSEEIKSGKYDSTIQGYILIQNEQLFSPDAKKNPENAVKFKELIGQMRSGLGVPPTTKNIDSFLESKVLGPDRDKIGNNMHRIGESGKYDRMTWDSQTRQVTFHSPGEKRTIETASIPPRETITRSGLSISKALDTVNSSELKRRKILSDISKIQETLGSKSFTDDIAFISGESPAVKELSKVGEKKKEEYTKYKNAREAYTLAKTPTEKLEALKRLEGANQDMDMAHRQTLGIWEENTDSTLLEGALWKEKNSIKKLRDIYESLVKKEAELGSIPKDTPRNATNFEVNARANLSFLSDLGYEKIDQNIIGNIISALNKKNGAGADGTDFIDPTLNTKLGNTQKESLFQALIDITRFAYNSGTEAKNPESQKWMDTWKNVDTTDQIITYRQTKSTEWKKALVNMTPEFRGNGKLSSVEEVLGVLGGKSTEKIGTPELSSINKTGGDTYSPNGTKTYTA